MSQSIPAHVEHPSQRFALPDLTPFQPLLDAVATNTLPPESWLELYLDTPDLALFRQGYTLAVTPDASEFRLTLTDHRGLLKGKLLVEPSACAVHSATVATWKTAGKPARWPKSLVRRYETLVPHARHARLIPLLWLHHQGVTLSLAEGSAPADVAHLAPLGDAQTITLDTIAIYPGAGAPTSPIEQPVLAYLYEATVAFAAAYTPKQLQIALQASLPLAALTLAEASTLARALSCASRYAPGQTGAPAGVQPLMPVAEACRLLLHTQCIAMLSNEAGVRFSAESEYVHEMRVAIRRARAALKLYRPFFRAKVIRPFLRLLRETAYYLGQVRDLDVALTKAKRKRGKAGRTKKGQAALLTAWQSSRDQAHQQLVAWLDSAKYQALLADFYHFCTTAGLGVKQFVLKPEASPVPQVVCHVLPSLLMSKFEQVRTYETLFGQQGELDYGTIHALRIDCKYLRYSLEFVRELLGSEGEELIKRLKALQELLGDLNDAVVALKLATVGQHQADPAYLAQQEQLIAELSAAVQPALATFVDAENRQRFGLALAKL